MLPTDPLSSFLPPVSVSRSAVNPVSKRRLGPTLLTGRGLQKAFGGQVVLDGVDLDLHQGEVVLLRGENGSGKTTLLNILTGNLEPDHGEINYRIDDSPRTYRFPRRWWQELNPFDHFTPEFVAVEGMGRTWQDVRLFATQSLRDNILVAEGRQPGENPVTALLAPARARRTEKALAHRADEVLAGLGLAGREESSADKISLGQSKRVAIARAVAAGARILFLDEPLAGLDRSGVRDVLALLEGLVTHDGVTLVIVEHVFNHPHLAGLITSEWLLASGVLSGAGTWASPSAPQQTSSLRSLRPRPEWFEWLAPEDGEMREKSLPRGALLTCFRRPRAKGQDLKPVLELRHLIVRRGNRTVIGLDEQGVESGLDLTLYQGDLAVLQAPNGWGKSTLFAALSGLLGIAGGEILLEGRSLNQLPPWRRAGLGLAALPASHGSFPSLTAREALKLAGREDATPELGSLAGLRTSSLSGGQKQRLGLLCQPSASRAVLRVLDEPFAMLDQSASREALRIMRPGPVGAVLIAVPSSLV